MAVALENGRRQFDYWLTVYKRTWKGSLISSFLLPMLYLAAMGIGLGSFVDSNGTGALGGVSYLQFIAPGLLAATALQIAVGESTYPVLSGLKWQKFYHSMIATPLRPADVVYGQLAFIAFRVASTCVVFLAVIAAFGGLRSPLGLLALPVVILVGMAASAPVVAFASTLQNDSGLAMVFRFGVVPAFLFSGAFFPVSQLPNWIEWLAYLSPLWHGVQLSRDLSLGTLHPWLVLLNLAYLLAWFAIGTWLAVRGFTRKLIG
ncbi:ABC transporter permease [Kribbella sandramycini]|uniref:Transport permease protein n=1 Tax=Kribbella sandramycini TaxID=60450 RepID=A0A7Y4L4C2_9ACTN|nr:ABC transporter permease [Kribbella sandramycini]MBB6571505.1 lipooligosaccharide transport system permease protein [Kribbella sandramycini]NOL44154.1 ABC transporter permease [Kribbella sandramycini]